MSPSDILNVTDPIFAAELLGERIVKGKSITVVHFQYEYAPGMVMNLVVTPYSVTQDGKVLSEAELKRLGIYHRISQSQRSLRAIP